VPLDSRRPGREPLVARGPARRTGGSHEVQLRHAARLPLQEAIASVELADELGFHACYAADETWHKDLWPLFAAAAHRTRRIRLGPSVSPVTLREPTLIAQALATLDELTDGRAEAVLSSGDFGLLAQYGIDWSPPVRRPG
jgi:alkanesulfonate monooxygenase SsuD/methylene tetrahydromethanopterin reductase-like flavin-dependent oxidoreductase (luciferase family)